MCETDVEGRCRGTVDRDGGRKQGTDMGRQVHIRSLSISKENIVSRKVAITEDRNVYVVAAFLCFCHTENLKVWEVI